MTLKVVGFSPARVPKLNEGLLLNRRQIEGDFSFLHSLLPCPFGDFPATRFSRLKFIDVESSAEAIKAKFKSIPDLCSVCLSCPSSTTERASLVSIKAL